MSPTPANGKVCYIEIPATDVLSSAEFYEKVFGWRIRQRGDGHTAFDDTTGEVSGTWVLGRPASSEPGLLIYIMVDSVEATADAVVANGGEIVQPIGVDAPEVTLGRAGWDRRGPVRGGRPAEARRRSAYRLALAVVALDPQQLEQFLEQHLRLIVRNFVRGGLDFRAMSAMSNPLYGHRGIRGVKALAGFSIVVAGGVAEKAVAAPSR